MNTKNLLIIQSLLLLILIIAVCVGIALNRLSPLPNTAVSATIASVSTLAVVPTAVMPTLIPTTSFSPTRWEYLSLSYSQMNSFSDDPDLSRYELVTVDLQPYATQFLNLLYEGCKDTDDSFTEEAECIARNFQGREFYLTTLGQDGWELIQVDNQSTEYIYHADFLFKRIIPQ